MIRISGIKLNTSYSKQDLIREVSRKLKIRPDEIRELKIVRKSLDARNKERIKYVFSVDIATDRESSILKKCSKDPDVQYSDPVRYILPEQGDEPIAERPCIVGAGPAGLFCAYFLSANGYRPVLIEQGEAAPDRQKTVSAFLEGKAQLDPFSNIQFGEGGAGTFSDGKLLSGVSDRNGRKSEVLKTFVKFGAPEEILYNAKPHVGTDILRTVIKNMREEIIRLGGTVLFNTRFTDLNGENGRLYSIMTEHGGVSSQMPCSVLVLAPGHSSRDTIDHLIRKGIEISAKPFAVGVRVQHLQDTLNKSQYGNDYADRYPDLPAADYKLTTHTADGRAVYSFCMCPGGYVINSSSEPGHLCINGMSYSGRSGLNANSAIIVSITPEDIKAENDPMAAIEFQRDIEKKAWSAANGAVPIQRLEDFRDGRKSDHFGDIEPQNIGNTAFADINSILPEFICRDIAEAMDHFGGIIQGFDCPDTLISAPESRTSSPVRILRDESLQSVSLKGLYPCGEGAGYAGGITSSAIDGIRVFEEIYKKYRPY